MTALPTPAHLLQIAREERARRRAARERAGNAATDIARRDDIIWSNIEQMAGRAARDPACLSRQPCYWTLPERIAMAHNIWATICKAETGLDLTVPANHRKVAGLWSLYLWIRPVEWSPHFNGAAA